MAEPYRDEELLNEIKRKNIYIRLNVGEKSDILIYKGRKMIVNNFGNDSVRYFFDYVDVSGIITKSFDNPSLAFAEKMAYIPFGTKVVISRLQKKDAKGNIVEGKSVYDVAQVE